MDLEVSFDVNTVIDNIINYGVVFSPKDDHTHEHAHSLYNEGKKPGSVYIVPVEEWTSEDRKNGVPCPKTLKMKLFANGTYKPLHGVEFEMPVEKIDIYLSDGGKNTEYIEYPEYRGIKSIKAAYKWEETWPTPPFYA